MKFQPDIPILTDHTRYGPKTGITGENRLKMMTLNFRPLNPEIITGFSTTFRCTVCSFSTDRGHAEFVNTCTIYLVHVSYSLSFYAYHLFFSNQ
jgi:hypothetical protein